MLLYVAHDFESVEKAQNSLLALQKNDIENAFISPVILFSHLHGKIEESIYRELTIDVLSVCDKLIIFKNSKASHELDFARLVGMEVETYENPQ